MNDIPAVLFAGAFMVGALHSQFTENAVAASLSYKLISEQIDNLKLLICKYGYDKEFHQFYLTPRIAEIRISGGRPLFFNQIEQCMQILLHRSDGGLSGCPDFRQSTQPANAPDQVCSNFSFRFLFAEIEG